MHQVRYVLALRESANFTRAADACGVSQPALTRAVRRLEAELGGQLFGRRRGQIRPTELGAMMLPHFEEIAARTKTAQEEATGLLRRTRKTLRLGVMCTIAPDPLLALVTTMLGRYPDIDLKITDFDSTQLESLLLESRLDVALSSPRGGQQDRFHYHSLFREQMLIVLHLESPLKDEASAEELASENYINRIHCEFLERPPANPAMSRWKVAHASDRDDWILAMVAAGMGFAFLPANCINHTGVVARPLADETVMRDVAITTVRGRPHSAAVGAFVREAVKMRWDEFSTAKRWR